MNNLKRTLQTVLLLTFLLGCGTAEPPLPRLPTLPEPTPTPTSTLTVSPTPTVEESGQEPREIPSETPTSTPTVSLTPPTVCVPPNGRNGWVRYTVRKGDTLFSLARSTNPRTTVQEIQKANCLLGTLILAGKPLYLPSIPVCPPTNTPPPPFIPTPTPVPPVEEPTAPPPGDPRVSVLPGTGPIPTIYTFEIRDFDPGEIVTIDVWSIDEASGVANFQVIMDGNGNLDAQWTSQIGDPTGGYFVYVTGGNGVNTAAGEFEVESFTSTPIPTLITSTPTPTATLTLISTPIPTPIFTPTPTS